MWSSSSSYVNRTVLCSSSSSSSSIVHTADQVAQVLQVELDSLWLCLGLQLPGGAQSRAGVQQRLPLLGRPHRLLFGKSHLTLDIFSLVCLQPLHRTLLRSACCCPQLPVEVWSHRTLGPQAWWRGSHRSPRRLPRRVLESLQRHFVKQIVVPVFVRFLLAALSSTTLSKSLWCCRNCKVILHLCVCAAVTLSAPIHV